MARTFSGAPFPPTALALEKLRPAKPVLARVALSTTLSGNRMGSQARDKSAAQAAIIRLRLGVSSTGWAGAQSQIRRSYVQQGHAVESLVDPIVNARQQEVRSSPCQHP